MSKFYSKSTGGFYDIAIHGTNMPKDVVPVTDEAHADLFNIQAIGGSITPDENGNPIGKPSTISPATITILNQIIVLENTITARRRDEAILGTDGGWLATTRSKITALRVSMNPPAVAPVMPAAPTPTPASTS